VSVFKQKLSVSSGEQHYLVLTAISGTEYKERNARGGDDGGRKKSTVPKVKHKTFLLAQVSYIFLYTYVQVEKKNRF
jgi:hypothetical protein